MLSPKRSSRSLLCVLFVLCACNRSSPDEAKIVGVWQSTYIEGVGHMTFTPDHKVTDAAPPVNTDGRNIPNDQFVVVTAGTWRLEGKELITEIDNKPLLAMYDPSSRHRPAFEKKVERRKIVELNHERMVFDDHLSLDRVK
jgi:hypothetical protein